MKSCQSTGLPESLHPCSSCLRVPPQQLTNQLVSLVSLSLAWGLALSSRTHTAEYRVGAFPPRCAPSLSFPNPIVRENLFFFFFSTTSASSVAFFFSTFFQPHLPKFFLLHCNFFSTIANPEIRRYRLNGKLSSNFSSSIIGTSNRAYRALNYILAIFRVQGVAGTTATDFPIVLGVSVYREC